MARQKILAILTGTDIVRLVNELISKVLRNIIFDKSYRGTARLIKVYIRFPWTLKAHYKGGLLRKDFLVVMSNNNLRGYWFLLRVVSLD